MTEMPIPQLSTPTRPGMEATRRRPFSLMNALTVAVLILSSPLVLAEQQRQFDSNLTYPTALAFDSSGNLYVASYPATIIKFRPDGNRSIFASEVLGSNGLAFDNAGDLFVLDGDSHSIAEFTADGTKKIFATGIRNPQGLGCDRAGNLFVSDVGTESILRFTPNGTKSTFAVGIRVPRNMAFDGSGNVFVYDALTNFIFKISPDGSKSEFARGVSASDLVSDKAGNLFVADLSSRSVIKFAPNGSKTAFVAGIPSPGGLAFDKAGNLFVSAQSTNSIFKFASDGTRTVFYEGPSQPSAAEEGEKKDSSDGLPPKYAKDYLIASSTLSPNKKLAVIYPKFSEEVADTANESNNRNYVVALRPFGNLGALPTAWPYFEHKSHGGISAEWSDDSSVGLITLDSKWGPQDVFLVELHDGKLKRITNILAKAHDLLLPNYRKAKVEKYNDYFDFIFEFEGEPIYKLEGTQRVRIGAYATTDPKGSSPRKWSGRVKAVWDIPHGRFISHKVSGHIGDEGED
jgi:sugar lactone lactonase YvrE